MNSKTSSIKKYLLYAIGEILLVMIGILLAIKVNNLNKLAADRDTETLFYQNLKRQLEEDQAVIKGTIEYNNKYLHEYKYAIKIIEKNTRTEQDTLASIALHLSKYSDFDRPSNIYESITSSGQLEYITNYAIIEKIQILEETYHYFNRMEEIHYDLILSVVPELITIVKYANGEVMLPDRLFDFQFQNIFITASDIMDEKDAVYHKAIDQISEITDLINLELGD